MLEHIIKLLKFNKDYLSQDGELLKYEIINLAEKYDKELITLLLSDEKCKEKFFLKVDKSLVFKQREFIFFLKDKNFFNDSYTEFGNKIGLVNQDKYIKNNGEVVLSFPFKDCLLEGGQSSEDVKRNEIFFNQILEMDEVDKLLAPKVWTNYKRFYKNGKGENGKVVMDDKSVEIKRDKEINKKRGLNEDTITDNLIIKGNNLLALYSLKKEFEGKVKLIYIDPPYNTGNDGFKYNDNFNHSTWLTFMKNRLEIARELLANDGSIYINMDYNEVHYCKILMDEIFGRDCFQREIIWRIGWLSGYKTIADNYIRNHDTILFYTKSKSNFIFNKIYNTIQDYADRFNNDIKREIFDKLNELDIKKEQANNFYEYISKVGLPEKYPLEDTWNSSIYDKLNSIAVVSFSGEKVSKMLGEKEIKGQKSEALLKRIIEISTNPNDIVLDYHLGSGTTAAVAHKMGRQYIGIEQMDYIENISVERLKKVIEGEQGGISKSINWKGDSGKEENNKNKKNNIVDENVNENNIINENNKGFVYLELAKWNQQFIENIKEAKDTKAIKKIWKDIKDIAFFKYNVEMKNLENLINGKDIDKDNKKNKDNGKNNSGKDEDNKGNKNNKENNNKENLFEKMSLKDQKQTMIDILDHNQLYVNLSDRDDKKFNINKTDKELNKRFYNLGK